MGWSGDICRPVSWYSRYNAVQCNLRHLLQYPSDAFPRGVGIVCWIYGQELHHPHLHFTVTTSSWKTRVKLPLLVTLPPGQRLKTSVKVPPRSIAKLNLPDMAAVLVVDHGGLQSVHWLTR